MKSARKVLVLVLCAVLIVAATAMGTLAYLTDTEAVTNTFTVGKVGLKLDEAEVNTDGTLKSEKRVQGNTYHLIPGHTYIKDPTVTVDAKSEESYVRMIVNVERIDQLKAALPNSGDTAKYYGADGTFLLQMLCNGWDKEVWLYEGFEQTGTTCSYEFRYVGNKRDEAGELLKDGIVAKSDSETVLKALFESITVPGEIDKEHLAKLGDVKIIVHAHAMQAGGFDNADDAWESFGK